MRFPIRYNYQGVVANYVSRPHLEKEIIQGLLEIKNPLSQINFPLVVLHGIGGMGKTTLARKICQRADEYFDKNIIWTDCEKEELIINSFAKFFGIPDFNKEKIQEILKKYYNIQFENRRCLLIFDNVNDFKMVAEYLPLNLKTNLSVLITSNCIFESGDLGEVKHIQVEKFTDQEFIEFVKKIITSISQIEIEILEEYTGKKPYLSNIVCLGLSKWKQFRPNKNINEYLEISGRKVSDYTIYKRTPEEIVVQQMKTIQNYYEQDGIVSCNLLHVLAYCNSIAIKAELIEIAENYLSFEKDTTNIAIEILFEQGFLERNETYLRIHHSYQKAIQNILRQQEKEQSTIERFFVVNSRLNYCVNYGMLWELGKEYGDPIFEKMINSKQINFAFNTNAINAHGKLQAYVKRTRSEKEYTEWCLSMESNELKFVIEALPLYKFDESEYIDLVEEYNAFQLGKNEEEKEDILSSLLSVALQKVEWLDDVKKRFGLLQEKYGTHKKSLLHHATILGNLATTKYLIGRSLDINLQDDKGNTPLHFAAKVGSLEVVKALWEAGADLNPRNNGLWTPLFFATFGDHFEIVQFLLSHNVDANLGLRYLKHLQKETNRNYREITQLFVKYGTEDVAK